MGAVLMQMNEKKDWVPIQWASKKTTPIETRYGISEKDMYAVFCGIKKFEYELRGRKFRVETDHKVLIEMSQNSCFNNTGKTDGLRRFRNSTLRLSIGILVR